MKVRFNLDKPNNDQSVIMMSLAFDGQRIRLSTRISVISKFWDQSKEKVKSGSANASQSNARLNAICSFAEKTYYDTLAAGSTLAKADIKQKMIDFLNDAKEKKKAKEKDLFDYLDDFIKEREDSGKYRERTIKHYKVVRSHLATYAKKQRKKLTLEDINSDFYDSFSKYLTVHKKLSNNSEGAIFKNFKTFMYDMLKKGNTTNSDFIQSVKSKNKEAQSVSLTWQELCNIESQEMPTQSLANTKDLFLFLCYTGVRFSDLKNLKPENIDIENGFIKIVMMKTEDDTIIPIHSKLKALLDKYPDKKLPLISNQKFNKYVKGVAKIAGIDTPVQQVYYIGRKRIEETHPKYELISSHTGRRSFITLSLVKGGLPEEIMKVSGHRDRKSFQKYVKIAKNDAVEKVKSLWDE